MNQFLEILTYFIIYSFFGWILESIFKTIIQKKAVNSGFLHGPFCPIYGVGALIMYFCLRDFKGNAFIVFCLGFVVLSVWEYIVGVLLEKIFNTKYWDYSDNKYNLQGRVCLLNSIFWGILGIIFIYFIHPFMQQQLLKIDRNIIIYCDIIFAICLIVDTAVSTIKVLSMENNLAKMDELNNRIKEKLEEIKEKGKNISKVDNGKDILEELKKKRERINRRLYKNVYRLKKAFPTMESDKITKILQLKRDLKKAKKIK